MPRKERYILSALGDIRWAAKGAQTRNEATESEVRVTVEGHTNMHNGSRILVVASLLLITLAAVTASGCFFDPSVVQLLVVFAVAAWMATTLFLDSLRGKSLKWWGVIGICLSIAISTAITHWPLHLRFHLSQRACDRLAAEIALGKRLVVPERAGSFLVREAGVNRNGVVYLWIAPSPAGSMGLAKCDTDTVAGEFNLWYTFPLSKDWQVVIED
jgi:hypothetical protein